MLRDCVTTLVPRIAGIFATSTSSTNSYSHTSENGLMSNGGLSFTYGNRESTDNAASISNKGGALSAQKQALLNQLKGSASE